MRAFAGAGGTWAGDERIIGHVARPRRELAVAPRPLLAGHGAGGRAGSAR